jgi:hypothetical protein
LLALVACDDDSARARPPRPASPVGSATGAREGDGGEVPDSVDPPAPAGDLGADIAAFTTLDACVAARSGVDPLVGDALEAIGYDTLLRDACRTLDAVHARDTKRCNDILASSLRAHCVAAVAEVDGDPDACPWDVATHPERGRDPVCIALASRDPRPCAGALEPGDRAACQAILAHDAAPCARLGPADRARCDRDRRRWASVITAVTASATPASVPQGKVIVSSAGDAGAAGAVQTFPVDVSRGVVLVEHIDGVHVVVGAPLGGGGFVASSPNTLGSASFELVVPADSRKARVESGEVRAPGQPPAIFDGSRASGLAVRVTKLERSRGGAVELSVSGSIQDGVRVDATASTFVRDVVKASALLGLPRLGDAGWMR